MRRPLTLVLALSTSMAGILQAQQLARTLGNFANVATYTISFPIGDARRFVSQPSWVGISWEGQWAWQSNVVVGGLLGIHESFDRSTGTTNFPSGAATGEQARELVIGSVLATGRWYPGGVRWHGMYLGLGAGTIFAQESYQLGIFDPLVNSAFHLALVPEAGVVFRLFDGVGAMVGARYTTSTANGSYLGGGARQYQFATITFSLLEH